MRKLLTVLPFVFIFGCLTTNQAYLPYNSRIFHKNNCVALRNNPPCIIYPSVQSAINSGGVKACSVCIKTNQYKSPSSYKGGDVPYQSKSMTNTNQTYNTYVNTNVGNVNTNSQGTGLKNNSSQDTYDMGTNSWKMGFGNSDGSQDTYDMGTNSWEMGFGNMDGSHDTFDLD